MSLIKCHECKHEISSTAPSCPNCGAKQKSKSSSGALIFILVSLVLVAIMCPMLSNTGTKTPRVKKALNPQIEKTIRELVASGLVHSVNVDLNQVRIDPLIWMPQSLENKQQSVMAFSKYFEAKGSTGRVEILSNRNDKKLATYSVWDGITILE